MFTDEEKRSFISNFPTIKLSYENIIHNKVNNSSLQCDICAAIPCGKKCFIWFTILNNKNVCFIMELIENKKIYDIKKVYCVFNNELSSGKYGTILYGTHFSYLQKNFFTIEGIYYYKGEELINLNTYEKFICISKIFINNDIKQVNPCNKKNIIFGFPLLSNSLKELKKDISEIKYKIYKIQMYKFNKINTFDSFLFKNMDSFLQEKNQECINSDISILMPKQSLSFEMRKDMKICKTNSKQFDSRSNHKNVDTKNINKIQYNIKNQKIFKIKPDLQNDIYHLYCLNKNEEIYYKIAYIPDYKTSVMMNKLFRNIKENENLDLLEESDDEDEFENSREDGFVDLNKSLNMICGFNYKFKKWAPISLANNSTTISQYSDLPV
jgi:hypothetical protein